MADGSLASWNGEEKKVAETVKVFGSHVAAEFRMIEVLDAIRHDISPYQLEAYATVNF